MTKLRLKVSEIKQVDSGQVQISLGGPGLLVPMVLSFPKVDDKRIAEFRIGQTVNIDINPA